MKNRYKVIIFTILFFFNISAVMLFAPISPAGTSLETISKESLQSSSNFSMNEIQASTICNRGILFAQEKSTKKDSEEQAQDDSTVTRGILIKVMLITMIVWFGLSVYLFSLSKKITKLEKKIDEL